ncbi:MAG: hypothetical protein EXR00_00375 [Alphaproteobacteria bacterium]|nr:hypothetical protein [Alphaproteobacteria bacterium]
MLRIALHVLTAALLGAALSPSFAADKAVPDLSGFWQHGVGDFMYRDPPSGAGPIKRTGKPEDYAVNNHYQGDYNNPMLKPWAAKALKEAAMRDIAGLPESTPAATCRPGGVPGALLYLRPVQFLQEPHRVTILYQYDHQSRTIHLNKKHSENLQPSWYGESVGHYEGDTLIVDTIGVNDKSWTDHLGTPHTDKIHVIERYRVTNGGKTLEVHFSVDDPGTFNWTWSAILRYGRAGKEVVQIEEEVCAENNIGIPIPVADIDPISGATLRDPPPS